MTELDKQVEANVTRERLEAYFRGAAFVLLLVVGAVATLRMYYALERAIVVWLQPQWVPVAQAVFSLLVLVLVVWLVRAWIIARAK